MQQWHTCKQKCADALLLFRMGDFYESFCEDAHQLSKFLDLTLTARGGSAMAGIPLNSLGPALEKLTQRGLRVAIAEQLEDPKMTKGLVKRGITRIVSPGTAHATGLSTQAENTYLAALHLAGSSYALASADISTGEFAVIESDEADQILDELFRIKPKEIICSDRFLRAESRIAQQLICEASLSPRPLSDWKFDPAHCFEVVRSHFSLHNLDGLGLRGATGAICAIGALLQYLSDDLCQPTHQLKTLQIQVPHNFLLIDRSAQMHLELAIHAPQASAPASLFDALNATCTAMGARLLRKWLMLPLKDPVLINTRQDAVAAWVENAQNLMELNRHLCKVRDLERLATKLNLLTSSPSDLIALRDTLKIIPQIVQTLRSPSALIKQLRLKLNPLSAFCSRITHSLVDEPALKIGEGTIFKSGVSADLDLLRQTVKEGKSWIATYQQKLRNELDIKTLRVGFTPNFGYFIEVSKAQSSKMPTSYQRRQTLVNNERFISPELKKYEDLIGRADEKTARIEAHLFDDLRQEVKIYAPQIAENGAIIAEIDTLASLAQIAKKRGYCRPLIDDSQRLMITEGRHPIVELHLGAGSFIPNDVMLDFDSRVALLTGPNMGGKSTFIRQIALLVIMAQMGGYVPAASMHLGVVDKIFTRIGASDELARGQSTFMVEMVETANILRNTTSNSLVVLDEIGRGTSTFDGIAIAKAIAEYLMTELGKTPRVLFATHYWELTELQQDFRQLVNYRVAVHEEDDQVRFLHKIEPGFAEKSFGIHVAKIAGNPLRVITRAREILSQLETRRHKGEKRLKIAAKNKASSQTLSQLNLFASRCEGLLTKQLSEMKLDTLTPLQALNALKEMQEMILQTISRYV